MFQLVNAALKDLGRPKHESPSPADAVGLDTPDPVATRPLGLLIAGRVEYSSGTQPDAEIDEPWQHVATHFVVPATANAGELAKAVKAGQRQAARDLYLLLKGIFIGKAGSDADQGEWRAVLLNGAWMQQTAMEPDAEGNVKVFVDCTYAFLKKQPAAVAAA